LLPNLFLTYIMVAQEVQQESCPLISGAELVIALVGGLFLEREFRKSGII